MIEYAPQIQVDMTALGTIRVSVTGAPPAGADRVLFYLDLISDLRGYNTQWSAPAMVMLTAPAWNAQSFSVEPEQYCVKARFASAAEQSVDSDVLTIDAHQDSFTASIEVLQDIFVELIAQACVNFSRMLQRESIIPFDAKKTLIAERLFAVDYLRKIFLEAGTSVDSLKRLVLDAESPYEIFFRVVTVVRDALASVDWRRDGLAREALAAADWRAAVYRDALADVNESVRLMIGREMQVDILKQVILDPDLPLDRLLTISDAGHLMVRFSGIAVTELMADALLQVSWSVAAISGATLPVSRAKVVAVNGEAAIEWLLNISVVRDAELAVDVLKKIFTDAGLALEYGGIKGSYIRLRISMLKSAVAVTMMKPECSVTMMKAECEVTMVK